MMDPSRGKGSAAPWENGSEDQEAASASKSVVSSKTNPSLAAPSGIATYSQAGVGEVDWGSAGKDASALGRFRTLLGRMKDPDRRLLLNMAQKMAGAIRKRV
jgi:hypothetical protein